MLNNNNVKKINDIYIPIQLEEIALNPQNLINFNEITDLEYKIEEVLQTANVKNSDDPALFFLKDSMNFLKNAVNNLKDLLNNFESLKEPLKTIKSAKEIEDLNSNIEDLLKLIDSTLKFAMDGFVKVTQQKFNKTNLININNLTELKNPSKKLIEPEVKAFSEILNETSRRKLKIDNEIKNFKKYIENSEKKLKNAKNKNLNNINYGFNANENVLMLNKKRKNKNEKLELIPNIFKKIDFFDSSYIKLKEKIITFNYNLNKKLEKETHPSKIKKLKDIKNKLINSHKKLKRVAKIYKELIENKKITENGEITDLNKKNEIEKLKKTIKTSLTNISNSLNLKITQNGKSYIANYSNLGKKYGIFLKNVVQKISRLKKCNKELFKYNFIKNLESVVKTKNNEMKNKPNEKTKKLIEYYYEKLSRTVKLYKNLKNNNKNTHIKNLFKKYQKNLNKLNNSLINKKNRENNLTVPPKFLNSKYFLFCAGFRQFLFNKNINIKNVSPRVINLLDSIKFLYDLASVLNYVDENGNIKNKIIQNKLEFFITELNSFKASIKNQA